MTNKTPYKDVNQDEWLSVTQSLVEAHPLKIEELIELIHIAWEGVWSTQIGKDQARISLREINPPATVVGYFFEKLLAKALASRYPKEWCGGHAGDHKDLYCITEPFFSIEVKASGQLGLKIFGNRSYGQEVENADRAKKDKSGYYLTVNFFGERLNLVRFGWIDGSDWVAQKSSTGQMAGLGQSVYNYKLLPILGDYTLDAPIYLLEGVGPKVAAECYSLGIETIREALSNEAKLTGKLSKVYKSAIEYKKLYGPISIKN